MSGIIRTSKRRGYASIPNDLLENPELSFEAKGLMSYLLSRPQEWQIRVNDLINRSPAGRDKIRAILRELVDAGYMVRQRVHTTGGHFQWETVVYDTPQTITEKAPCGTSPSTAKPSTAKPSMVEPSTVRPSIYREVSKDTYTERIKLREETRENPPPPTSTQSAPPAPTRVTAIPPAIEKAFQTVTGKLTFGGKDRAAMVEFMSLVASSFQTPDDCAAEIVRRFSAPLWTRSTRPWPSQVLSDWNRQAEAPAPVQSSRRPEPVFNVPSAEATYAHQDKHLQLLAQRRAEIEAENRRAARAAAN